MKTTTMKTTAPTDTAPTDTPPPAELPAADILTNPKGNGERELDEATLDGVQNMTADLCVSIDLKIPRYTEAALRALNACGTLDQKHGVKLCYEEMLRGLFAAMQNQAVNQFEGHMEGFSPFAKCLAGSNEIV